MLRSVRKFLKNNSPDWLNTEVNKDLLQNLTANIKSSQPTTSQTNHESEPINILPSPARRGAEGEVEQVKPSLNKSYLAKNTPLPTANYSLSTVKGTPHWRRIRQVFQALDNAPPGYTYNQLIEYVREATGKGCSRKLISKWKKQKLSQKFLNNNSGDRKMLDCADRHTEERSAAISASLAIVDTPSTVNCKQLTDSNSLMTVKAWSYLAAAGIAVGLVGCELTPLNNNRPTENIATASVTAPITPLTPISCYAA